MYRFTLSTLAIITLTLTAQAGAESYFEERAKDFGIVPRGPTLVHYFKVTNNTKEIVGINSLRVSCGCTTVSAPVSSLKPGESTFLTAQMDTRRFIGHKAVTIYVTFSQPRFEEVTLVVQANARDDFGITPDTLAFGSVRKGSEPRASVQVSFLSDPTFTLKEPKADSNYVKPEIKLIKRDNGGTVYEVSAKLRSDLPVGNWITDLWVPTSNAAMPKLRIPLTVEVQPAIAVSPSSIQFNPVRIGEKTEQKVLVRAEKPFSITDIKGLDDSVKVQSKMNEKKSVHILTFTFEPNKVGELNRSAKIVTDSGEAEVLIPVRGIAN
jgi:hypothetical protein